MLVKNHMNTSYIITRIGILVLAIGGLLISHIISIIIYNTLITQNILTLLKIFIIGFILHAFGFFFLTDNKSLIIRSILTLIVAMVLMAINSIVISLVLPHLSFFADVQ